MLGILTKSVLRRTNEVNLVVQIELLLVYLHTQLMRLVIPLVEAVNFVFISSWSLFRELLLFWLIYKLLLRHYLFVILLFHENMLVKVFHVFLHLVGGRHIFIYPC